MASRFWNQGDSESEEEQSDYDEEVETTPAETTAAKSDYYRHDNATDSDDDDGQKRVVRSAKDKRFEEMASTVDQMKNAMKINDWVSLQESFDKINKQLENVMRVTEAVKVPSLYIRSLVLLEDFLLQAALANKDAKKKMGTSNAKAFNAMKQKLKKNNKQYEELINKCRESPEGDYDDTEDEYESDGSAIIDDPELLRMLQPKSVSEASQCEDENPDDDADGPWDQKISKKDRLWEKQFTKNPSEVTRDTVNNKFKENLAVVASLKILKSDFESLPNYMKGLASWEDLLAAVDKINSSLSKKTNECNFFRQDDIPSFELGHKARSYLLLLVRMNRLVVETTDGLLSYRIL